MHICTSGPIGWVKRHSRGSRGTVIIAPTTSQFGGAAVLVASVMGARVIMMDRNVEVLARLKTLSRCVETAQITGNKEEEVTAFPKFGPADAFFDISP